MRRQNKRFLPLVVCGSRHRKELTSWAATRRERIGTGHKKRDALQTSGISMIMDVCSRLRSMPSIPGGCTQSTVRYTWRFAAPWPGEISVGGRGPSFRRNGCDLIDQDPEDPRIGISDGVSIGPASLLPSGNGTPSFYLT